MEMLLKSLLKSLRKFVLEILIFIFCFSRGTVFVVQVLECCCIFGVVTCSWFDSGSCGASRKSACGRGGIFYEITTGFTTALPQSLQQPCAIENSMEMPLKSLLKSLRKFIREILFLSF